MPTLIDWLILLFLTSLGVWFGSRRGRMNMSSMHSWVSRFWFGESSSAK